MSENLKAAAYAAGLSDKEKGKVDSLSKLLAVHKELSNLPSELAQRQAGKYTPAQQDSLVKVMGNEDPMTQPSRGWLGSAWHYTGGQVANLGGKVLAGLQNVSDFSTRLYRTGAISLAEGVDLETAWKEANDKGDKKFNPNRIEDARSKFGNEAVDVAMRIASGEKIDEIIKTATPEQQKYLMLADPNRVNIPGYDNKDQEENARGLFQDTLDAVQASKYSPGRQIANLLLPGFLEGSGFAYKAISGSIDAAYRVFADPLLLAGKVKTLNDIRKYSVEVITGSAAKDGVKFNQYFDLPSTKNFWDAYGAKLKDLRKAQDAKDTIAVTQIKKDLSILAPEFGPAVIQSFNKADEPIEDVLTAKGFFLNAKQTGEMMAGSNGRRKVIAPRLTPARQLRVATLTTANQLFNIDKIGNELVNAQFFGEDATDVGIYKALIEGKEQIVQSVQALNKSKKFGPVRFSTADINVRIDNLKRKVSIAPMFKDNELDVIAKDAPDQMYRLARLVLPQRESKLISEAFSNTPEIGKRKEMFYGLWSTITDIRGINTTEPTRNIARSMVGKGKMKFGVDDPLDDIGAFATDFNSKVTVPNLVDLDRLTARSTIGQKLIGPVANSAFLEKATGYWSFLTLAGPRYALRNATEDLMVNLAIGSTPWGIATGRRLNTRVLTAMPAKEAKVRDLLNVDTMADSPLGAIMRIVNKDESAKYSTQIAKLDEEIVASKKKISDLYKLTKTSNDPVAIASAKTEIAQLRSKTEGGLVEQTRKILATALSEGRVNRYLDAAGLGKLDDLGIELLGEQIVYGNYEDVLSVISEGGFNFATGGDFLSSAVDTVRQVNSRTAAVRIEGPKKKYTRQAGQVGFKNVRLDGQDEATLVSWLLRISYISNDELGKVAVANLHKKEAAAILEIKKAIQTNPDLVDASILSARGIDIDQHAKLVYDRTKEVFVMSKNGKINEDLLGKVRILDPETGQYVVQGKISLDDLPVSEGDIPKYVVGPSLVPVSDTQNYAATFTQSGWRWLGMANARMSRQPIVTNQMIQIRKQMRKSGFEDAWIKSYTKDIDPNSVGKLEEATKKAKEDLEKFQTYLKNLPKANISIKSKDLIDWDQFRRDAEVFLAYLQDMISAFGNLGMEARRAELYEIDVKENKLNESYKAEQDRINKSYTNRAQKEKELIKLDARKEAQQKQIDRERLQATIRAAKFQKGIDIAELAAKTAQAVMAGYTKSGLVGAAMAGALGAVQLATIMARPLPQFAKGTESSPEGYAVVGEKGTELVTDPSGKSWLTPAKDTITYLKKGSKVTTNEKLMEMVKNSAYVQLANLNTPVTSDMYSKTLVEQFETLTSEFKALKGVMQDKAMSVQIQGNYDHYIHVRNNIR